MFLQGTEAFRDKGRAFQMKVAGELRIRPVIKGEVVCREGAPLEYVYFVKSGEFQVMKKVVIPSGTNDGGENTDKIKTTLAGTKDTNQKKAAAHFYKMVT